MVAGYRFPVAGFQLPVSLDLLAKHFAVTLLYRGFHDAITDKSSVPYWKPATGNWQPVFKDSINSFNL
jgi:hypothetical protein